MATNRMYLMHRPSRKAVWLGKRLDREWRGDTQVATSIQALFDFVAASNANWSIDDFCIALEIPGYGAALADFDWSHGERHANGTWVDELGLKTLYPPKKE